MNRMWVADITEFAGVVSVRFRPLRGAGPVPPEDIRGVLKARGYRYDRATGAWGLRTASPRREAVHCARALYEAGAHISVTFRGGEEFIDSLSPFFSLNELAAEEVAS